MDTSDNNLPGYQTHEQHSSTDTNTNNDKMAYNGSQDHLYVFPDSSTFPNFQYNRGAFANPQHNSGTFANPHYNSGTFANPHYHAGTDQMQYGRVTAQQQYIADTAPMGYGHTTGSFMAPSGRVNSMAGHFVGPYDEQYVPHSSEYTMPGMPLQGTQFSPLQFSDQYPATPLGNQSMMVNGPSPVTSASDHVAMYGIEPENEQTTPKYDSITYNGGKKAFDDVVDAKPDLETPYITYDGVKKSFSDAIDAKPDPDALSPKPHGLPMSLLYTTKKNNQEHGYDLPTIPLSELKFRSYADAEAEFNGRTPLNVWMDDFEAVEKDKLIHVAAIMAAFEGVFRPEPNVPIDANEKGRWVRYQKEQVDKTSKHCLKNPDAMELSAWKLLEALLDIHKFGYKRDQRVTDPNKCCSQRFAQMVRAISNYAVIRFDLVRMQRIDDLATSPAHVVSRKVANWRGNAGKVKRDEANKEFAIARGVPYSNVLGAKRKLKTVEDAQVVESPDTFDFDTPLDAKKRRTKRNIVDEFDGTPSKAGRRKAAEPDLTRYKQSTVTAGPDADF